MIPILPIFYQIMNKQSWKKSGEAFCEQRFKGISVPDISDQLRPYFFPIPSSHLYFYYVFFAVKSVQPIGTKKIVWTPMVEIQIRQGLQNYLFSSLNEQLMNCVHCKDQRPYILAWGMRLDAWCCMITVSLLDNDFAWVFLARSLGVPRACSRCSRVFSTLQ